MKKKEAKKTKDTAANRFRLQPGMTIGTTTAETDVVFLSECFVDHPTVHHCIDVTHPGMVLLGRTGAGKTAILQHIRESKEKVAEIVPSDMSMSYVSNSDALLFLKSIGADLDLLFQALWKHVLCVEYIRLRYSVTSEVKSKSIFQIFHDLFSPDQRKKRALEYLKGWEGKFWIEMDENIKELISKIEERLHAEIGTEIGKYKAGGQYEKRLSTDKKSEIIRRIKNIIDGSQLQELNAVITMLSEETSIHAEHSYYVLIDRLDEKWVETSIRFQLIRSLVECLKSFRKISNLKILIALRADILERTIQETIDMSYQKEKLEQYFIGMRWTKSDLRIMLERRISMLFRRQYSSSNVAFAEIFPHAVLGQDPFDYIVFRTLMRPRDVIDYVNKCIELSGGNFIVTAESIRRAEILYSVQRREAIIQEWQSAFPLLSKLIDYMANLKVVSTTLRDFSEKTKIEDFVLKILTLSTDEITMDPIKQAIDEHYDEKSDGHIELGRKLICILYRVGVVGIKIHPNEPFSYSHLGSHTMDGNLVDEDAKIRVHEMLHAALQLRDDGLNAVKGGR